MPLQGQSTIFPYKTTLLILLLSDEIDLNVVLALILAVISSGLESNLCMCLVNQKLGLGENWCVYEGEVGGESRARKEPICRVRKNMNILHVVPNTRVLAYIYDYRISKKKYAYSVEGSYGHRSCKVLDASRKVVAEVKRKEAVKGGVCFGAEVFLLLILPDFEPGLAMALVLLLDQMFS